MINVLLNAKIVREFHVVNVGSITFRDASIVHVFGVIIVLDKWIVHIQIVEKILVHNAKKNILQKDFVVMSVENVKIKNIPCVYLKVVEKEYVRREIIVYEKMYPYVGVIIQWIVFVMLLLNIRIIKSKNDIFL